MCNFTDRNEQGIWYRGNAWNSHTRGREFASGYRLSFSQKGYPEFRHAHRIVNVKDLAKSSVCSQLNENKIYNTDLIEELEFNDTRDVLTKQLNK